MKPISLGAEWVDNPGKRDREMRSPVEALAKPIQEKQHPCAFGSHGWPRGSVFESLLSGVISNRRALEGPRMDMEASDKERIDLKLPVAHFCVCAEGGPKVRRG